MLHATLHGKLSDQIPEPQRLEDSLTSTVFGTMLLVGASEVVANWFAAARDSQGTRLGQCPVRCVPFQLWFWPRLYYAEPDVVVRIGNQIFIVEAKFRSGRHDQHANSTETSGDSIDISDGDQLVRQVKSIERTRDSQQSADSDLTRSLRSCEVTYIYLVDQGRLRRARREILQSASRLPADTNLRLLMWQDLYRILIELPQVQWSRDLGKYLELIDLDSYTGQLLPSALRAQGTRPLNHWRPSRSVDQRRRVEDALSRALRARPDMLLRWKKSQTDQRSTGVFSWRQSRDLLAASEVVRRWRHRPSRRRQRSRIRESILPVHSNRSDVMRALIHIRDQIETRARRDV